MTVASWAEITSPEADSTLEQFSYQQLAALQIPYRCFAHQAGASLGDFPDFQHKMPLTVAKNLFLRNSDQSQFYLLVLPRQQRFRSGVVARQIGSTRLSLASPEQLAQYLQVKPGCATILSLLLTSAASVQLLVARSFLNQSWFACHPFVDHRSVLLRSEDAWQRLPAATGHAVQPVTLATTSDTYNRV